jgi:uncharacterized membrane protein
VLYGIVLAVTFGINVPLNNQLEGAGDPARIADLAHVRSRFEGPWVAASIVRTVLVTAAVGALGRALFLHGRATTAHDGWAPPFGPPHPSTRTASGEIR